MPKRDMPHNQIPVWTGRHRKPTSFRKLEKVRAEFHKERLELLNEQFVEAEKEVEQEEKSATSEDLEEKSGISDTV